MGDRVACVFISVFSTLVCMFLCLFMFFMFRVSLVFMSVFSSMGDRVGSVFIYVFPVYWGFPVLVCLWF